MEEGVHFPKRRVGLSHLHSQAACVQPKNWYETYPAPIVSFPGACHGMPPPTPSSMIYSSHGVSSYLKGVFALKRKLRWLGFGLVGMLLLSQCIRPNHTNPPIDAVRTLQAHTQIPPQVETILQRSWNDCHSNHTEWPWYSQRSPISWYLQHHVNEGRRELNLSDW